MVEQCHQIYHMLDISIFDRPRWDLDILRKLGVSACSADTTVGRRLYPKKDKFYDPAPLFGIVAVKLRKKTVNDKLSILAIVSITVCQKKHCQAIMHSRVFLFIKTS